MMFPYPSFLAILAFDFLQVLSRGCRDGMVRGSPVGVPARLRSSP